MEKTNWKRNITAFLTGQAITLFGSSLVQYAIIWYIARTTSSGVMVTLSTICSFLPQVLISLFAGVWADRHSRKMLINLADAAIAVTTLILAFLMMSGEKSIWILIVVSAIRSVGTGVQTPAVNALIPQLVPEEKLMRINGINGSVQSIINLVAPAVSGAVLSYGPIHNILFIDVVTAAIGITILLLIPVQSHQKAEKMEKGGYFQDLKEGVRYSFQHKFVRQLLFVYMIFTILIVPAAFLNVLFVTRTYGDSYWYLTLNEMAFFVGATIGGLLLGIWGGFRNRLKTFVIGLAAFGILTFAVGLIHTFWLYLVVMLLTGLSMPLGSSPVMVLLQEKVDIDMQGRVFSLIQIVFSAFMPLGMAVFGPLADVMPIAWLMIGSGIALILLSVAVWRSKGFYRCGLPE